MGCQSNTELTQTERQPMFIFTSVDNLESPIDLRSLFLDPGGRTWKGPTQKGPSYQIQTGEATVLSFFSPFFFSLTSSLGSGQFSIFDGPK